MTMWENVVTVRTADRLVAVLYEKIADTAAAAVSAIERAAEATGVDAAELMAEVA